MQNAFSQFLSQDQTDTPAPQKQSSESSRAFEEALSQAMKEALGGDCQLLEEIDSILPTDEALINMDAIFDKVRQSLGDSIPEDIYKEVLQEIASRANLTRSPAVNTTQKRNLNPQKIYNLITVRERQVQKNLVYSEFFRIQNDLWNQCNPEVPG